MNYIKPLSDYLKLTVGQEISVYRGEIVFEKFMNLNRKQTQRQASPIGYKYMKERITDAEEKLE